MTFYVITTQQAAVEGSQDEFCRLPGFVSSLRRGERVASKRKVISEKKYFHIALNLKVEEDEY